MQQQPIKPVLHGRVFRRLQQYRALSPERKREVEHLEKHITKLEHELFGKHHTLTLKSVRGVKYKQLLEAVYEWVVDQETYRPVTEPSTADQVVPDAVPVSVTDNATPTKTSDDISTASSSQSQSGAPASASDAAPAATTIPVNPAIQEDIAAGSEAEADAKRTADEATKSGRMTHAKKLIDALVLKGFITPNKEDKSAIPTEDETFDFKDSELLVPLAAPVTGLTIPTTTVWDLVDGAVFAELIKRKAGLLAPLTHGKDVYVVVNSRARSVTLFDSDVAREPILIYEAALTNVTFDKSHYENGIKLWSEDESELLNMASIVERDALIAALEAVGVKYQEQFPIMDHHAKPANFTTSHTYTVEELTEAASDAVPLDDTTETLNVPRRHEPTEPKPTEVARNSDTTATVDLAEKASNVIAADVNQTVKDPLVAVRIQPNTDPEPHVVESHSIEPPNHPTERTNQPTEPTNQPVELPTSRPSPFLQANQPGSPGMPSESEVKCPVISEKSAVKNDQTLESSPTEPNDTNLFGEPTGMDPKAEKNLRFEEPYYSTTSSNQGYAATNGNANATTTPVP